MVDVIGTSTVKTGLSYVLQLLTGIGIGVVGELAAYFSTGSDKETLLPVVSNGLKVGDPLTFFFVCIAVAMLMKIVLSKKTSVIF